MKHALTLLAALAVGCGEGGADRLAVGRDSGDLLRTRESGVIVGRVPVAGAVKGVWPIRPAEGERVFVAATGREGRRGGADIGKILLLDTSGARLDEFSVPRECPFVDSQGRPLEQINATSTGLCDVVEVEGRDWFLFTSSGTWAPRWFGAFTVENAAGGSPRLQLHLEFWNEGHIDGFRAVHGRSLYLCGMSNSTPRPVANDYGLMLCRIELPREDAPVLNLVSPNLGKDDVDLDRGFTWHAAISPLRPTVQPTGVSGRVRSLALQGARLRLSLSPPGMESTFDVTIHQDGAVDEVSAAHGLRKEYLRVRGDGEPAYDEWVLQCSRSVKVRFPKSR